MSARDIFRKMFTNDQWAHQIDSNTFEIARTSVMAILSEHADANQDFLKGARKALDTLATLHHPPPPPPRNSLASPLRHDLESVQRGKRKSDKPTT